MSQWPAFIEQGFEMMYGEFIPDEAVEAFASRWGGLAPENWQRALLEGQGEDRLLALGVIGWSDFPQASSLLLPFLHSQQAKERWFSALGLGRMKQEAARPLLVSMLTDSLPSEQVPFLQAEQAWFDEERIRVALTLGLWDDPSFVPVFRQAYHLHVQAEQYLPDLPGIFLLKQRWYLYQETLMRILGHWGALGVLAGMVLPPYHLRLAIINLALGYCQVAKRSEESGATYRWQDDAAFTQQLKGVLTQRFGIAEEEQDHYLEDARKGYLIQWRQLDQDHYC